MKLKLKKILGNVDKVFNYVISMSMVLLTILVFFQFLNRFILHLSASWTEESARYVFVWVSLLASIKVFKEGEDIRIGIIIDMLNKKAQSFFSIISDIISIVFGYFLFVSGLDFTKNAIGQTFEVGRFPIAPFYSIIPITGLLFIIISSFRIIKFKHY